MQKWQRQYIQLPMLISLPDGKSGIQKLKALRLISGKRYELGESSTPLQARRNVVRLCTARSDEWECV